MLIENVCVCVVCNTTHTLLCFFFKLFTSSVIKHSNWVSAFCSVTLQKRMTVYYEVCLLQSTVVIDLMNFCTLSVVRVECSMSETARRTPKRRKIGSWCICDAPRARAAGPSPHLGCVFVQRRRKRRMARPEGPSRCFGCGSFVVERRSSGEGRANELIFVASDLKRQIWAMSSRHRVFPREPIRHTVVNCPRSSHTFPANRITTFSCAYTVRNCSKIINTYRFLENQK